MYNVGGARGFFEWDVNLLLTKNSLPHGLESGLLRSAHFDRLACDKRRFHFRGTDVEHGK